MRRLLGEGGDLAIKAFQGEGLDNWVADLRKRFERVNMMKPKASRPESREVFVVARGFITADDGNQGDRVKPSSAD